LRFLVFQHGSSDHPGIFRDLFAADRIGWDAVDLSLGQPIPDLSAYDALWVMGGIMNVWQEEEYPWLKSEKAAIRSAVIERSLPYFGVCLGHQLLADALGGEVGLAQRAEIGLLEVEHTAIGQQSPFLASLPTPIKCLQWHEAEVKTPPPDAKVLAWSPHCSVQALAIADKAFGIQYHAEVLPTTLAEWFETPGVEAMLEEHLGQQAMSKLNQDVQTHLQTLNSNAKKLYENWKAVVFSLI
jgi:GMP synthase-like glutamine amidotransferase